MLGRYPITWSWNHEFWFWVVRIELELGSEFYLCVEPKPKYMSLEKKS
jgi:hypothetical protein